MYCVSSIYNGDYQKLQAWRREIIGIIRKMDGWGDFQIAGQGVQNILWEIKDVFDYFEKTDPGQWRQRFGPEHLALYDSIEIIGKGSDKAWFPSFKAIMERAVKELSHVELKLFLLSCCDAHNGLEANDQGMHKGEFFTGNDKFAKRTGSDKAAISGAWKTLAELGYVKRARGHKSRTLVRRVEMLANWGSGAESKDAANGNGEGQE